MGSIIWLSQFIRIMGLIRQLLILRHNFVYIKYVTCLINLKVLNTVFGIEGALPQLPLLTTRLSACNDWTNFKLLQWLWGKRYKKLVTPPESNISTDCCTAHRTGQKPAVPVLLKLLLPNYIRCYPVSHKLHKQLSLQLKSPTCAKASPYKSVCCDLIYYVLVSGLSWMCSVMK